MNNLVAPQHWRCIRRWLFLFDLSFSFMDVPTGSLAVLSVITRAHGTQFFFLSSLPVVYFGFWFQRWGFRIRRRRRRQFGRICCILLNKKTPQHNKDDNPLDHNLLSFFFQQELPPSLDRCIFGKRCVKQSCGICIPNRTSLLRGEGILTIVVGTGTGFAVGILSRLANGTGIVCFWSPVVANHEGVCCRCCRCCVTFHGSCFSVRLFGVSVAPCPVVVCTHPQAVPIRLFVYNTKKKNILSQNNKNDFTKRVFVVGSFT